MTTLALPPLGGARQDTLEIVSAWDADTPYQQWRPQILVPPSFAPSDGPHIYAVVNQKGGAGKTTSSLELAAAWVAAGYTVRLIDADPQEASLSAWLKAVYPEDLPADQRRSLRSVFFEECTLADATYPTRFQGLHIVPSGADLARVEYERPIGAEHALAVAFEEETDSPDITIIDGAPSLGLVTVAVLTAARKTIVPVKVGGLDMLGMASLHKTIRKVQRRNNPKLGVISVLLTAWDKSGFARQLATRVSTDYPEAAVIPIRRSVRVAEAPITGDPIRIYAPDCTAASDYDQAAGILTGQREARA